eukprot:gene20347-24371_t
MGNSESRSPFANAAETLCTNEVQLDDPLWSEFVSAEHESIFEWLSPEVIIQVLPFIYEGMSLTAQNSTQVVPNTALQINFDALTKLLLRLLFCGALTIPLYSAQNTCLWASGIGPGKARPEAMSQASQLLFKTARVELLRCLVATGCESIFLTASTYVTAQRIALSALANNLTAWNAERGRLEAQPQANNLFASLLNTVCTSEDAGPGLFSSGGKTTDSYLMEYSVHVLLLLLDYPESDVPPVYNAPDPSVSGDPYMKLVAPVATPSAATVSVFRDLWLRIQAWPELKFVNQGLDRAPPHWTTISVVSAIVAFGEASSEAISGFHLVVPIPESAK